MQAEGKRNKVEGDRSVPGTLIHEIVSGASGFLLAVFMWGHVVLVGSILTGERGFDWLASALEHYYIAQPTVVGVIVLFLVHAVFAARKIPTKLSERRAFLELSRHLKNRTSAPGASKTFESHLESMLWIWQVRTGLIILVLASFHIGLLTVDVLTPLFGERQGIEAVSTLARVQGGLWLPYAILLVCVEFHASVGLYRLAIKWGGNRVLSRATLHALERVIFWLILGLGALTLVVLAGVIEPPLAFLLEGGAR